MRLLDIGCGPAYLLEHLPGISYYGFDTNCSYIEYAKRKYGDRGYFCCQPFSAAAAESLKPVDAVLMAGLLHHLNDNEAQDLLNLCAQSLKDDGRLFTLDGCYVAGQSPIAKILLQRDRGRFVREEPEYVRLASSAFRHVNSVVRHDLFSVPYTANVMVCRP
jgi:SAM-dependent methyltransferase